MSLPRGPSSLQLQAARQPSAPACHPRRGQRRTSHLSVFHPRARPVDTSPVDVLRRVDGTPCGCAVLWMRRPVDALARGCRACRCAAPGWHPCGIRPVCEYARSVGRAGPWTPCVWMRRAWMVSLWDAPGLWMHAVCGCTRTVDAPSLYIRPPPGLPADDPRRRRTTWQELSAARRRTIRGELPTANHPRRTVDLAALTSEDVGRAWSARRRLPHRPQTLRQSWPARQPPDRSPANHHSRPRDDLSRTNHRPPPA